MLPRADLRAGDLLVGLRSNGAHTNGYSLIRHAFSGVPLDACFPELTAPLGEILLAPHRSYLPLLAPILDGYPGMVKALAHITGGGLVENIPRVLPVGIQACLHPGTWPVPGLFVLVQRRAHVSTQEMHRVFNMGIGMAVVIHSGDLARFQQALGEESWVIGELAAGDRKAVLQ
jgi:phosphoribosylformylglycinamidine cyclo-ligase/phosphoribosylamine--glycine ligase/phosphoribosylformylglycinamidine cyclo-ligase